MKTEPADWEEVLEQGTGEGDGVGGQESERATVPLAQQQHKAG